MVRVAWSVLFSVCGCYRPLLALGHYKKSLVVYVTWQLPIKLLVVVCLSLNGTGLVSFG